MFTRAGHRYSSGRTSAPVRIVRLQHFPVLAGLPACVAECVCPEFAHLHLASLCRCPCACLANRAAGRARSPWARAPVQGDSRRPRDGRVGLLLGRGGFRRCRPAPRSPGCSGRRWPSSSAVLQRWDQPCHCPGRRRSVILLRAVPARPARQSGPLYDAAQQACFCRGRKTCLTCSSVTTRQTRGVGPLTHPRPPCAGWATRG